MSSPAHALAVPEALQLAIGHHQSGRLQDAEAIYRAILEVQPENPDALHLLGLIVSHRGDQDHAADLLLRALDIRDNAPPLHNNLGNIYRLQGRLDDAAQCFERALALYPGYAEAHYNMGAVLEAQGHSQDAVERYRQALALDPKLVQAHGSLGNLLLTQGHIDLAVAHLAEAVTLAPGVAQFHAALGNALRERGDFGKAVEYCSEALRLAPDSAGIHNGLGRALKALGRIEQAIDHFRAAVALDPQLAEAHNNLGNALKDQGHMKQAAACYLSAIRLKPAFTEAIHNFARGHKFKFCDEDASLISRMEALLGEAGMEPEKARYLHFALGKAYDDLGRHQQAFAHYQAGNEIERKEQPFDREQHAQRVSRLIETYTPEFFLAQRHIGNPSQLPVLVVGMPRSGTTLLEQILSSHPAVFGAGELGFWGTHHLALDAERPYLTRDTAARMAEAYLSCLRALSPTSARIIDKMPSNFLHLGLVHQIFPNARIIHARRNPIDTCLSIYFTKFVQPHPYAHDLDSLAFYYREYERIMRHWREVLPAEVFLEVQYEELLEDQETVTRCMLDFCQVEWDAACLRFHDEPRAVSTASNWQVRQPLYKTSAHRWKDYEPFIGPLRELLP